MNTILNCVVETKPRKGWAWFLLAQDCIVTISWTIMFDQREESEGNLELLVLIDRTTTLYQRLGRCNSGQINTLMSTAYFSLWYLPFFMSININAPQGYISTTSPDLKVTTQTEKMFYIIFLLSSINQAWPYRHPMMMTYRKVANNHFT